MSDPPSPLNELLRQELLIAQQHNQQTLHRNTSGTMLEIPSTGTAISSAYEHLRNAAEYAEEHLLLQRAIKRFYKRNLFVAKRSAHDLGTELIVDLVQAGYLGSSQYSKAAAEKVNQLIAEYLTVYGHLRQAHIKRKTAEGWTLALMSSETENILNPEHVEQATLYIAYHHFRQSIPREGYPDFADKKTFEFCLYIAIHQSILKSDIDLIRHDIHKLNKQSLQDISGFIQLNRQIDTLNTSRQTQLLKRIISRQGAPFRILKSLNASRPDIASLLPDKQRFLEAYNLEINREYSQVAKRLTRGITKSIIFLFITKVLVGLLIEIPYDLLVHGSVIILPLAINLLFPPIYMASLKLSLRLPTAANKHRISDYMEKLLYSEGKVKFELPRPRKTPLAAQAVYSILFALPVIATIYLLQKMGFNLVQMAIFFVFFSTATFLGFRLSTLIRDLELVTRKPGLLGSLRDFFYLPFILSGQWLSRRYSQVNIVGTFMDSVIELPLKSILRLVRQWMGFLHEKHEELY